MMKAGEYYIGDLCYVIRYESTGGTNQDNWDRVCELICGEVSDGEFNQNFPKKDGSGEMVNIRFACYGTTWGDGLYSGRYGEYGVDSGTIGCIALEDLEKIEDFDRDQLKRMGAIVTFTKAFSTGMETNEDGRESIICIGDEQIDTDPVYEEEDDYDYYEDEEEDERLRDEY